MSVPTLRPLVVVCRGQTFVVSVVSFTPKPAWLTGLWANSRDCQRRASRDLLCTMSYTNGCQVGGWSCSTLSHMRVDRDAVWLCWHVVNVLASCVLRGVAAQRLALLRLSFCLSTFVTRLLSCVTFVLLALLHRWVPCA